MEVSDYFALKDVAFDPYAHFVAVYGERIQDDLSDAGDYYLCLSSDGEMCYMWGQCPSADKIVGSREEVNAARLKILENLNRDDVFEDTEFDDTCRLIVPDFDRISDELIEYCSKHPEVLEKMNWRKFEELLAAVFKNQGYHTQLGPGSGDGGVDIRLVQKDSIGEVLTLVQAKRYKANNPIGLEAVQALHGVVDDQRAHRGLFVTTSRYLPGALQFAERQNERLILADSQRVADWCLEVASKPRPNKRMEGNS